MAGQSRASHSGTDRGSVGRGRARAGVGGRGLMAGASEAGIEQSPVRPAIAGGRMGTPSRSRGTAVAAGGSAVSPADMRTVQRPAARAPVSVSLILTPLARSCLAPARLDRWVGRPRQSPPAPPCPRRRPSWHPQGHPACTNPGGGQSEGRWHLACQHRPRKPGNPGCWTNPGRQKTSRKSDLLKKSRFFESAGTTAFSRIQKMRACRRAHQAFSGLLGSHGFAVAVAYWTACGLLSPVNAVACLLVFMCARGPTCACV